MIEKPGKGRDPMKPSAWHKALQKNKGKVQALAGGEAADLLRQLEKEQLVKLVEKRTRELEQESAERMRTAEALSQQNGAFRKLNHFSHELLRLSSQESLEAFIARQIREITGAKAAAIFSYDPSSRTIIPQHIDMESALLEKVVHLLGRQFDQLCFPVSDTIYQELTTENIGTMKNMYEASFGAISLPVGAAIQALLKVDRFIGLAFLIEGELYGTSVLAMAKGQPDPPRNILENLAALAAVSLQRRRAEDALQLLMARNQALLDSIPDIVVEVDNDKVYKWANPAGIEFYGEDLVGREAAQYFAGEQDTYNRVQPLFAGDENTIHVESWQYRRDGEKRLLSWRCRALKDSHGNVTGALSTARDITERMRTMAALWESEKRFRGFMENAPIAISVVRKGNFVYGNDVFLRLFGVTKLEQIVGQPGTILVAPQCRVEVLERAMRRDRGEPVETEFEMIGLRMDGLQFPCRMAATKLDLPDGHATMLCCFDLTTQKESEKKLEDSRGKLRNLAVHLLHAREEERKRVAREMHDDLGQVLTALKMDLQWIDKKLVPRSTEAMEKIQGAIALADQTIEIVHRISLELRPGLLDDLGLSAAIEWLGGDFSRRHGIPCRMDIAAPESRIGGNSSTVLFRIIQEALANVARHAQASHVSVKLWEVEHTLRIHVQDDGCGITEEQSLSSLSLGLIGIRERVQGLGGAMSLSGRPGEGTILEVTIPLPSTGALA
jgi:PAS domain S-box-containing protein